MDTNGHPSRLALGNPFRGPLQLAALLLLMSGSPTYAGPAPVPSKAPAPPETPQALMELAKRFQYGVGAPQNLDRAIQLFCRAADLGYAEAAYQLGWIYSTGRAGKVDEILAAQWFKAAAAGKDQRANEQLHNLGADSVELPSGTACVMPEAMVARTIPKPAPGGESATAETAQTEPVVVREAGKRDIEALIRRLAPDYKLDPDLVLAMVAVESNFNPTAVSPKNAQGLMQLIPETAQRFGVRNVWDPIDNLRGGMSYMRWLLDHFNGNLNLALAGYNAGEKAVQQYGGIPPFPETRNYVKQVTSKLGAKAKAGPIIRSTPTAEPVSPDLQTTNTPAVNGSDDGANRT
jgi:hypothetical protein